jgi:hypothetical protein
MPIPAISSILLLEEVRSLFHQLTTRPSPSDPILLSIDIAHGNIKRFSAIGASLLDTRCLTSSTPRAPSHHTRLLLHTQTFQFQDGTRKSQLAPCSTGKCSACDGATALPCSCTSSLTPTPKTQRAADRTSPQLSNQRIPALGE